MILNPIYLGFILVSMPLVSFADDPNRMLLPHDFAVYVNGTTVINHPTKGFSLRWLPTNNDYRSNPGCYIACYSHTENKSAYNISSDIYVMGQIRVPGSYFGRICNPKNFEHKDISAEQQFKTLCQSKIGACYKTECWAGGDTGGWFGIQ